MWGKHSLRSRATSALRAAALGTALTVGATLVPAAATSAVTPDDVAPEDFITLQYRDFLARNPDAGGLDFWSNRLRNGAAPAALIETMASSPEFVASVAPMVRLYQAHFRRTPDYEGLVFWVSQLSGGRPIIEISEHFSRSDEFQQRYGALDDGAYVDLVYQNVLGRLPDASGRAFWLNWLAAGGTRGDLMAQFSESKENVAATDGRVKATMLYLGLLRRVPDPQGLAFWSAQIQGGMAWSTAMQGFLYSPEYQRRLDGLFTASHPLTGEATAAPTGVPALALKIDNVPLARPQQGIGEADLVVEEMVEGTFTRLIAVFQSGEPAQVGPVRSIRSTDFDVLAMLDWPLLGASGANTGVLQQLAQERIVNVNAIEAGNAYYRVSGRRAPHNMFVHTSRLREFAAGRGAAPAAVFSYRPSTATVPGVATGGVRIDFGSAWATWAWDGSRRGWTRTQNNTAHIDTLDGATVAPDNVVVLEVAYDVSLIDTESPEARTVGSGRVWVFTGGQMVAGTWTRGVDTDPFSLKDANGNVIGLTPGQTWLELAPTGSVTLR